MLAVPDRHGQASTAQPRGLELEATPGGEGRELREVQREGQRALGGRGGVCV